MSLRGSLTDLFLPDLLQIVSANGKTGRLRVTTANGEGLFVFRDGRIIYGATNAHRESFGSALVLRGLITPEQLQQALDRKARGPEERRLGNVLLQMGAVTEDNLSDVLRGQLREVTAEMFRWRQGVVEFEEMDIESHGEVSVDAQEFVLPDGLPASGVLLAMADDKPTDELSSGERAIAALDWWPESSLHASDAPPPQRAAASLTQILAEFHTPLWPGEVSLAILRAGAGVVLRGVLLLRAADGFRGLGQFGVWDGDQAERVRALRLANQADSLLGDVARTRQPFRGNPDHRPHNLLFFRFLESDPPPAAIVLPVIVGGEVQLLFYGDNLPAGAPIADTGEFERFLGEVGRAMESPADS